MKKKTKNKQYIKTLNHLLNIGLRYGDIEKNKKIFSRFLECVNLKDMKDIVRKGIEYFELVE